MPNPLGPAALPASPSPSCTARTATPTRPPDIEMLVVRKRRTRAGMLFRCGLDSVLEGAPSPAARTTVRGSALHIRDRRAGRRTVGLFEDRGLVSRLRRRAGARRGSTHTPRGRIPGVRSLCRLTRRRDMPAHVAGTDHCADGGSPGSGRASASLISARAVRASASAARNSATSARNSSPRSRAATSAAAEDAAATRACSS